MKIMQDPREPVDFQVPDTAERIHAHIGRKLHLRSGGRRFVTAWKHNRQA